MKDIFFDLDKKIPYWTQLDKTDITQKMQYIHIVTPLSTNHSLIIA